jgi:hypothetical protein
MRKEITLDAFDETETHEVYVFHGSKHREAEGKGAFDDAVDIFG